jgi:hypothetical protein
VDDLLQVDKPIRKSRTEDKHQKGIPPPSKQPQETFRESMSIQRILRSLSVETTLQQIPEYGSQAPSATGRTLSLISPTIHVLKILTGGKQFMGERMCVNLGRRTEQTFGRKLGSKGSKATS